MEKRSRRLLLPVICLLLVLALGGLGQLKEEVITTAALPASAPFSEGTLEQEDFAWDQPRDMGTYYLQIENTGDQPLEAHVTYGFPWPGYILTVSPGDTWELAVFNAHPRLHTIDFTTEEGTPSGTVKVWLAEAPV